MSENLSLIEKEAQDQIKAHSMAHQYYLQFKKQFEQTKIVDYKIELLADTNTVITYTCGIGILKDCWQPFGSPFVRGLKVYQCMVKYADN